MAPRAGFPMQGEGIAQNKSLQTLQMRKQLSQAQLVLFHCFSKKLHWLLSPYPMRNSSSLSGVWRQKERSLSIQTSQLGLLPLLPPPGCRPLWPLDLPPGKLLNFEPRFSCLACLDSPRGLTSCFDFSKLCAVCSLTPQRQVPPRDGAGNTVLDGIWWVGTCCQSSWNQSPNVADLPQINVECNTKWDVRICHGEVWRCKVMARWMFTLLTKKESVKALLQPWNRSQYKLNLCSSNHDV